MALKVYTSGNYIITDTGTVMHEFAKGYTTYSYNQTSQIFTVRESVGGSFTVTRAQLLAGDITNESSVAYTFNTFVTFLRENTGFKTATGGSVAAPIGATLLKTGQTTSYRTGDDGDIEAGRAVDFFTLSANNPFNNTNRFTDELGGQTYTNNIVIDWSTYDGSSVLGYYRLLLNTGGIVYDYNWNDAIDKALTHSISSYVSGWRMWNKKEAENIVDIASPSGFSGVFSNPLGQLEGQTLWTSSTLAVSTTNAWYVTSYGIIAYLSKISTARVIAVRTFTVSGTTLS